MSIISKFNKSVNQKGSKYVVCAREGGANTTSFLTAHFAIWIFVKKSSDFNQKAPLIFRIRILGDCCLAPPKAGLGFGKDFEGIFEIQKQFLPAQTEGRFAEGKHKFEKFINQSFFLSPLAKGKAII